MITLFSPLCLAYYLPITNSSLTFSQRINCNTAAAAAAKSLQSCPTLCDSMDCSPPGSPVPGILQARTLEWVAISFSNAWKWKVKGKWLSHVRLLATSWTAAYEAPLSMGFSRQEYWSGVPLPSPLQHWNISKKKKTTRYPLHPFCPLKACSLSSPSLSFLTPDWHLGSLFIPFWEFP